MQRRDTLARMKVFVDPQRCQGHTLCNFAAPEIFTLDDTDGHAQARDGDVPPDEEAAARIAVAGCPEQAITLSE